MVDIIDLALIGEDGVTFDGGIGTSNNIGMAFHTSYFLFLCSLIENLQGVSCTIDSSTAFVLEQFSDHFIYYIVPTFCIFCHLWEIKTLRACNFFLHCTSL